MSDEVPDFANELRKRFAGLSSIGADVAQEAAGSLFEQAQTAWDSGTTPFGEAFGIGKSGERITLDRTGAMKASETFVPRGTQIVCSVGVSYAKYNVKFGYLPKSTVPKNWDEIIGATAAKKLEEFIR